MECLRATSLAKNFGGIQVLQEVTFSLNPGENLALIGPNGAGKTTLINILSGMIPPTRGQVTMLGKDITHAPVHTRLHMGLAYSFQLNNLFFNLSVLDNILLALQGKQSFHLQL